MATDLLRGITLTQDPGNNVNWTNPSRVNDGDDHTSATVGSGGAPYSSKLVADLGTDYIVDTMWCQILDSGGDVLNSPEYSDDGSAWTTIPGSWGAKVSHNGALMRQYTILGGPITHRYFRAGKAAAAGGHGNWAWSIWEVVGSPVVDVVVAEFSGSPTSGAAPLEVTFTDLSTGDPDTWAWDFGDGGTSTSQNPTHTFTDPGTYDVELVATRSGDSATDTVTHTSYVVAIEAIAGVFIDWDNDGFDVGDYDAIHDQPGSQVVNWSITRGASAEITGGAQPGSATITLKNPDDIYNYRNASSPLYGLLGDGVPIWIGPNSDGALTGDDPRGLFGGRITDITSIPSPGTDSPSMVEIVCEDFLSWSQRLPVQIEYAEGRSHGALREVALLTAGETRYDLAHEITTMPLSHADSDLRSVLDGINAINGTRHLAKPSDVYTAWFDYTTRNRQWRLDATSDASLSASADHVTDTSGWRLSADTVTNRQKATVTPIQFTPGTFTVWEAETLPFGITDTKPYVRIVEYDDVVRDPVVDFASSGDTVTATLERFATGGKVTLSVATGDSATITALSIEGRLARRLVDESYTSDDTDSQTAPRGVREGSEISGEYLGVIASARGIAQHVTWRYGNPQLRPTLTVVNWLPEQFELDLYDVISFTSTHLGMSNVLFEIVGLTHTGELAVVGGPVLHTTTYVLQECRVQNAADFPWFVLNSSTLAAAGTDVLGY